MVAPVVVAGGVHCDKAGWLTGWAPDLGLGLRLVGPAAVGGHPHASARLATCSLLIRY